MAKKSETYENMMKKLEQIVNNMDGNELPLEEAIASYEEGIAICNKLYRILNDAEGKIKILTNDVEKDFLQDEE